jgi:penicillin-binding protein 1A
MGITTPLDPDPAIALGGLRTGVSPLEMASAFGTIANGGLAVAPSGVLLVLNDRGEVVYAPKRTTSRALDAAAAAEEAAMLHNVVEKGTGVKAKIGRWAAGKTGTTQSYRDAWFVGWSGDVSTAVWVGHRDGQVAMTDVHGIKVTGGSFPASIWAGFMRPAATTRASAASPAGPAVVSAGVQGERVLVRICQASYELANPRCPHTEGVYLDPLSVPKRICTIH